MRTPAIAASVALVVISGFATRALSTGASISNRDPQSSESRDHPGSFHIDIGEQPTTSACVGLDGTLYVLDIRGGHVLAYDPRGAKLWQREIAPDLLRKTPLAADVDREGFVYVYESFRGDVHVLDRQGGLAWQVPVRAAGVAGRAVPGMLVADNERGFYVIGSKDGFAVHRFDGSGQLTRSLATLAEDNPNAKGWIGRGPDGTLYFRSGRNLRIDRFSPDGSPMAPIEPQVSYDSASDPGDTIFATRALSDGRLVMEIAHRTPYQQAGAALNTTIQLRTYLVNTDGSLARTIPGKGLGQLGAVSDDWLYYFNFARGLRRTGEATRVVRIPLH